MKYVKTNWKTGDVVTSNKLNNMETGIYDANEASASAFAPDITNPQDGDTLVYNATQQKWVNGAGGGGSLVANGTVDATDPSNVSITLDKTAGEIYEAFLAGSPVIVKVVGSGESTVFQIIYVGFTEAISSGNYIFRCYDGASLLLEFLANAGTDYPVCGMPS